MSNFQHKLLLTNTKFSRVCKTFANGSSGNTKFSKSQLYNTVQLGGFLGRLLGPLLKTVWPLMKNVLRNFFVPLGLMATASVTGAAIQKKTFGSGRLSELAKRTTLVFSNDEIDDIIRIVKCIEDVGLLIKGVIEAVEN